MSDTRLNRIKFGWQNCVLPVFQTERPWKSEILTLTTSWTLTSGTDEKCYLISWIRQHISASTFLIRGVRVFANGPGDLGSIPGRVIPKTQKMVLDASLLNTQHYKVRIKGKVEQSREGVAPSPTPRCSSYRKGSLQVTLDYGRQLYLLMVENKNPTVYINSGKSVKIEMTLREQKQERNFHIFSYLLHNYFVKLYTWSNIFPLKMLYHTELFHFHNFNDLYHAV